MILNKDKRSFYDENKILCKINYLIIFLFNTKKTKKKIFLIMQGLVITFIIFYFHCYNAAYVKKTGDQKIEIGLGNYVKALARNASSNLAIDIYYESKCPDSARFINEQLDKALPLFADYVDFRLVPFGKANVKYIFLFLNK
jgi:hypothetical protein